MHALLILEKLTSLDNATRFMSVLEIKFISDEKLSSQISFAKKSLDQALLSFTSDIDNKLTDSQQNSSTELKLSSKISYALEQLKDCGDGSLNNTLQDLISFTQRYETNPDSILLTQNSNNLADLKAKILLITAERFN